MCRNRSKTLSKYFDGMTCEAEAPQRRNLPAIAAELAAIGHLVPSAQPCHASSIRHMLAT
jgi:hypothetical protein